MQTPTRCSHLFALRRSLPTSIDSGYVTAEATGEAARPRQIMPNHVRGVQDNVGVVLDVVLRKTLASQQDPPVKGEREIVLEHCCLPPDLCLQLIDGVELPHLHPGGQARREPHPDRKKREALDHGGVGYDGGHGWD